MMNKGLLMWGEFPPRTQTGVSISNEMIYRYLGKFFKDIFILEEFAWKKNAIQKIMYYLRNNVKLFRLVHKHNIGTIYFVFPLSRGGLIKRLFTCPLLKLFFPGIRLIGHIHRGDFNEFVNKHVLNRMLVISIFRLINKIIVLSPSFVSEIKKYVKYTEISILYNTSPVESQTRKSDYRYHGNFICISNYIRTKGLMELVECFSAYELSHLQLKIYGAAYEPSFLKRIKKMASKNINFCNPFSRIDLPVKLMLSDCLIVSSWNEGQPIVILEAMSVGLPIISTSVGDIPNMLGRNYPFLVEPANTLKLREAVLAFDKYDNKENLASELYKRYSKFYSNSVYEKQLIRLFGGQS